MENCHTSAFDGRFQRFDETIAAMPTGIFRSIMMTQWRQGALGMAAGLALLGALFSHSASAAGWMRGIPNDQAPVSIQQTVGAHRWTAKIIPMPADVELGMLGPCYGLDRDRFFLIVERDGEQVYSAPHCPAYGIAHLSFHVNALGVPFLFVDTANGYGPAATTRSVDVYGLGGSVMWAGNFVRSFWIRADFPMIYEYRISAPPNGDLVVDTRAVDYSPGCCYDNPQTQHFVFKAPQASP